MTKVLYVEHNDDNLYMLKTRLELLGDFEVLAAEDSEKGCKLAVTERPDLILMDLEMPIIDRWEAVRRLKNDPQTTSRSSACPRMRWPASARRPTGCDEFDAKPIEFERLVATIRRVLANPNKCSDRAANQIQDQDGAPPIMRASLRVMARPSPVLPENHIRAYL